MAVNCTDCPTNPLGDDIPCQCQQAVEDDNILFGVYRSWDCVYMCSENGIPRSHTERRHEVLWGLIDW